MTNISGAAKSIKIKLNGEENNSKSYARLSPWTAMAFHKANIAAEMLLSTIGDVMLIAQWRTLLPFLFVILKQAGKF